ncbi:MAG: MFS transporter [Burkholderiaceae bacterium]
MTGLLRDRLGPVATIALAQLFGTSLWFSANGAADDLLRAWQLSPVDIGLLTSMVQAGFILGTLWISLSGVADRYRPSAVFVCSAIAGAAANACFALLAQGLWAACVFRFIVGLSLAGIYPIGMKLMVGWAPQRAGAALSMLVAMLTVGTALPHALREAGAGLPWQLIIVSSSLLALLGAAMIHRLGDGPQRAVPAAKAGPAAAVAPAAGMRQAASAAAAAPPGAVSVSESPRQRLFAGFRDRRVQAAAVGYFGHMWELYAFWTLVPLLVAQFGVASSQTLIGVSGFSFCVIAIGAVGAVIGGRLSRRIGSAKVAIGFLVASGLCLVLVAMGWRELPIAALAVLLLLWGATVVADSPHFSALTAQSCPPDRVGSTLAIQNSIGFLITVVSISMSTALFERIGADAVWLLLPGPVFGVIGFALLHRRERRAGVE